MNIWFISDTHFGHDKIINYFKRPFQSIEEMNSILITNWNKVVKPDDTVFHLGDFSFDKSSHESPTGQKANIYKQQLNGNIILLKSRHDENNHCKTVINSIVIFHGGKHIFITHNPKNANLRYEFNFTGHSHGVSGTFNKKENSIIVDLSVENWNYTPVSIQDILVRYEEWKKQSGI